MDNMRCDGSQLGKMATPPSWMVRMCSGEMSGGVDKELVLWLSMLISSTLEEAVSIAECEKDDENNIDGDDNSGASSLLLDCCIRR